MGGAPGEGAVGREGAAVAHVRGEPVLAGGDAILIQAGVHGPLGGALGVDAADAQGVLGAGGAVGRAVPHAAVCPVDLGALAVRLAALAHVLRADRVVEVLPHLDPISHDLDELERLVGGLPAAALLDDARLAGRHPAPEEHDVVVELVPVLTALVERVARLQIEGADLVGDTAPVGGKPQGAGPRRRQPPGPGDESRAVGAVGIPERVVIPVAGVLAGGVVAVVGRDAVEQLGVDPLHRPGDHLAPGQGLRWRGGVKARQEHQGPGHEGKTRHHRGSTPGGPPSVSEPRRMAAYFRDTPPGSAWPRSFNPCRGASGRRRRPRQRP